MPPFSGHPSSSLSTHPSFLLATRLVSISTVWSFQECSINETTSVQPLELFFPPQCDCPEIHSLSSTLHQLLRLYCHRPGDPGPFAHFLLSTSPVVVEDMDLFTSSFLTQTLFLLFLDSLLWLGLLIGATGKKDSRQLTFRYEIFRQQKGKIVVRKSLRIHPTKAKNKKIQMKA